MSIAGSNPTEVGKCRNRFGGVPGCTSVARARSIGCFGKVLPVSSSSEEVGKRTARDLQLNAGFSLLELLVVLVLLAMLVALALPSVGAGLSGVKLQTSSREIAAAIRLARASAVRQQEVYFLAFNLDENELELSNVSASYRKSFQLPDGIRMKAASLLHEVQEREVKTPVFYFMPNGNSQSFEVSLQNERGRLLKVVQSGLNGGPRIEEADSAE